MHHDDPQPPPFGGAEAVTPYESASVVVLPVPYEGTVSYGRGTAGGPAAILRASAQVELYDERLRLEPYRTGIWTEPALEVHGRPAEEVVELVEGRVGALLDDGKLPIVLGGEHSITPGGVAAAVRRHSGLHVVQLDAHADLRQSYEGTRWSHACAMARCLEHAPVRAIGIRNYSTEEAAWIAGGIPGYQILHGWELDEPGAVERALTGLDGVPVYLTIDVDYFDPAIVPATGTPEPGGGAWWPTMRLLDELFRRARVVAADVVELAPIDGLHHADFTVARLVHTLAGRHRR